MRKPFLVLFAAGFLAASLAVADDDDPPGRAARLSFISGTVTFQPGSVEDWVPATLNRPMTTGDRLWTEAGGRAEMHIGSAAVRLNGRTNFAFLNLDDRTTQIQVSVGTVSVRLRRLNDDESFEIDTPQMALTLLRAGEYRVEVDEDGGATVASVRGGSAEATAGSQAYTIRPLEQLRVTGTDQVAFDQRPIPPADAFDNFCEGRDRREDTSQSARYVSRDVPGYSDLDNAGVWRQDPDYGAVWVPSGVPADWAPYHYGHWAWIAPWGWTWVDDAAWGYAPFHYGRWVFAVGSWGWVPGPIAVRPVYSPAMVAWVGGAGFGVGVAVGGGPAVGWFALGPREVWVPSYHYSPAYIERVNVTNTVIVNRTVFNNVNVTNVNYVNRNVAGAVTVVPQSQMTAGRPVAAAAVRMPPEALARAQVQTTAAVAPERGAVLGGRAAVTAAPPAAVMNRQVAARQAPPPAPVPFARQQQVLRQNPGQPIPRSSLAQIQAPQNGGPGARPAFRQVGPPAGAAAPNRPGQAATPQPQPGQFNRPGPGANPQSQQGQFNRPGQAPAPQSQPGQFNRPVPSPAPQPQAAPPQFNRGQQNREAPPQPEVQRNAPEAAPPSQPAPQFNRGQQNRNAPPQEQQQPRPQPQPEVQRNAPAAAPPSQPAPQFNRGQQNRNTAPQEQQQPRPQPQPEVQRNAPAAAPPSQPAPQFNRGQQNRNVPPQEQQQPRPQSQPEVQRSAPAAASPSQPAPRGQQERPAPPPRAEAPPRTQAQPAAPPPAPPPQARPEQNKRRPPEDKGK